MTSLLLDLGNTRLKWAWLGADGLSASHALVHAASPDESLLEQVVGPRVPDRVICSSVAQQSLVEAIDTNCRRRFQLQLERPVAQAKGLGLTNSYAEPDRMGVDRWLAMAAAFGRVAGPVCVIDAGTAITVDLVDADGRHRGGWIAPGVGLMRGSLHQGTGQIPPEPADANAHWGRSTAQAVTLGVDNALAGLTLRAADQVQDEIGASVQFLVTGGDGQRLLQYLDTAATLAPDLVLEGLALWARPEAGRATD